MFFVFLISLQKNGSIIPVVCDIVSKSALANAAATIKKQTPFVNAVVANAGIAGPWDSINKSTSSPPTLSELQAHLWATSDIEANEVSAVNVIAAYFTFLAFLPLLEAGNTNESSPGKSGYIPSQFITTSSVAGYSRKNMVGFPYGVSKAALTHLTKMLSTEFAGYGIRVNGLAPGFFRTEATEFVVQGTQADLSIPGNMPKEASPALRAGSKEDIAGAILYLVSRAGGFVNGCLLLTDGGVLGVRAATY